MEDNKVSLKFDKDFTVIDGWAYGKEIYNTQIKGNIDMSKDFYIEIPEHIELVCNSFVGGLFFEIASEIGLKETKRLTHFIHSKEYIVNSIKRFTKENFYVCHW